MRTRLSLVLHRCVRFQFNSPHVHDASPNIASRSSWRPETRKPLTVLDQLLRQEAGAAVAGDFHHTPNLRVVSVKAAGGPMAVAGETYSFWSSASDWVTLLQELVVSATST